MMEKRGLFLHTAILLLVVSISVSTLFSASIPQTKYRTLIRDLSSKYGVPEDLVHSIIIAESNYNPNAVSKKGALGLMQLMPETAKEYGVLDPLVPEDNIDAGIKYIKKLIDLYNGDVKLILAAYNAGPSAVEKYGGVPPFQETQEYIQRVRKNFVDPVIRQHKVYTFTDDRGRIVLTNKPYLSKNRLRTAGRKDIKREPDQRLPLTSML